MKPRPVKTKVILGTTGPEPGSRCVHCSPERRAPATMRIIYTDYTTLLKHSVAVCDTHAKEFAHDQYGSYLTPVPTTESP